MIDLSKAEDSKRYANSYISTIDNIIDVLTKEKEAFLDVYNNKVEPTRKDRAAIIEETIPILKNNHIKPTKQLGNCNNDEINAELSKAIEELTGFDKEATQINLVKINNRYETIIRNKALLDTKVEAISDIYTSITKHYGNMFNEDRDEEVEVEIPKKAETNEYIEVIETKEATPELVEDLEEAILDMQKEDMIEEEFDEVEEEIEDALENEVISEEDIKYDGPLFDTDELSSIQDEMDSINGLVNEEEDEIDYARFKMPEKLSLKDIAREVYHNEEYWRSLYFYDNNKNIIDSIAINLGVNPELVATTPGFLADVELQMPTILNISDSYIEENKRKRAA